MTRSVEITEEAVMAVAHVLGGENPSVIQMDASRIALEVALPYLAPADRVLVCSNCEGCDVCCGEITDIAAAPAVPQPVDREALVRAIMGSADDWLTRHLAGLAADRVLAVLAGSEMKP